MSAESADKNVQTDHVQEIQHIADFSGLASALLFIPVRRREATVETLIH